MCPTGLVFRVSNPSIGSMVGYFANFVDCCHHDYKFRVTSSAECTGRNLTRNAGERRPSMEALNLCLRAVAKAGDIVMESYFVRIRFLFLKC